MAIDPAVLAITDEELTRLALAADPEAPLPPDAVPFRSAAALGADDDPDAASGLLPDWYMPAPSVVSSTLVGRARRRRIAVIGLIILALLAVNAAGLCVTNGRLEIAW